MGIYIYTLRKPMRPIMLHGEPVMAALLKFLRKPHFDLGSMDRTCKMLTEKAVSLFPEVPKYVVMDEWAEGVSVYRWKGRAWCYDEPYYPGYNIGKLVVKGRGKLQSLSVDPLPFTHMPLKMVEPGYDFTFDKSYMELFNKAVNKDYTESDIFTMRDPNTFGCGTQLYGIHVLPSFAGEWGVRVDLRELVDMTNVFESIYS